MPTSKLINWSDTCYKIRAQMKSNLEIEVDFLLDLVSKYVCVWERERERESERERERERWYGYAPTI